MELMKRMLPVVGVLALVACSSKPAAVQSGPARYADASEVARLQAQARANFEKEKQRQGSVATAGSAAAPAWQPTRTASAGSSRRGWSAAESRYAMQIGKSPGELTSAERAAARNE